VGLFSGISEMRNDVVSPESTAKSLLKNGIGSDPLFRFKVSASTEKVREVFDQRGVFRGR